MAAEHADTSQQPKRSWTTLIVGIAIGACVAALVFFAMPKPATDAASDASSGAAAQEQTTSQAGSLDIATTFLSWNTDCTSLAALTDFVQDVCDESSPNYVEPKDRIATFDMDGTIIAEKAPFYLDYILLLHRVLDDPDYHADAKTVALCEEVRDYPLEVAAYSAGEGFIDLVPSGYEPCHDAEAVEAAAAYDPEADLPNTPDSVFCAHGAGYTVKWSEVAAHTHVHPDERSRTLWRPASEV